MPLDLFQQCFFFSDITKTCSNSASGHYNHENDEYHLRLTAGNPLVQSSKAIITKKVHTEKTRNGGLFFNDGKDRVFRTQLITTTTTETSLTEKYCCTGPDNCGRTAILR